MFEAECSVVNANPAIGPRPMSKLETLSYLFLFWICAILQIFTFAAEVRPQEVEIEVRVGQAPSVSVTGKGFAAATGFGFLRTAGGAEGLEKRISNFRALDAQGREIEVRKLQPGEYLAERSASNWQYEVDLAPPPSSTAAAHISWIGEDVGLLMPADLLPIGTGEGPIKLTLSLPAGWSTTTGGKVLDLDKAEAAVIMFAKDLTRRPAGQNAAVNISGDWNFSPEEAAEMADEIIREYSRLFGGRPAGSIEINILPFPLQVSHGTWQAETRGRAVTIVSGDMAFRTQSLQRLHEQLRHELFHIWMPNGVNLTGSYDWFYEGFALYQSLKTAVAVNRIGFTDMTATLSRAYAIDRRQRAGTSLLDSSRNRWAAGGTEVYARGMLVAFLTDIAMLERSGGKRSIQDLFRDIYGVHSTGDAMDGNEAVLGMMEKRPELKRIIEKYIRAGDAIDEVELLKAAGFELGPEGLKADAKPGGRQKTILDRLGYNNWRRSPKILK
jgi:hypothetical protein